MKYFFSLVWVALLFGCSGGGESQGDDAFNDAVRTDIGGVENVKGNIPDTITMGATPRSGDNAPPIDSTYADTAR